MFGFAPNSSKRLATEFLSDSLRLLGIETINSGLIRGFLPEMLFGIMFPAKSHSSQA